MKSISEGFLRSTYREYCQGHLCADFIGGERPLKQHPKQYKSIIRNRGDSAEQRICMRGNRAYKWVAVALTCFAAIYAIVRMAPVLAGREQGDFSIYYYAAMAYQQGLNPYQIESLRQVANTEGIRYAFVYPPYTLAIFGLLAGLEFKAAFFLFFATKLLACACLVWIWSRVVPTDRKDLWVLFVTAVLGYRSAMLRDLRAGNVSVFEQALIWGGIVLLMKRKTILGTAGIMLSSGFKLLTIALGPVVIVIERSWRSFVTWLLLFTGFVLACLVSYVYQPKLWAGFVSYISSAKPIEEWGNACPSSLAFLRHLAAVYGVDPDIAFAIYIFVCCLVLGVWLWAYFQTSKSTDVYPMLYLTILAYVLIAPRMKDYSFMIALLPTLHIISAACTNRWSMIVGCLLLWASLFVYQSLALAVWSFAMLVRWIWNNRHTPDKKMMLALNPLRGLGEVRY
jgi:hypothetical protein